MNDPSKSGVYLPYFSNPLCGSSDPSLALGDDGYYYSVRSLAHAIAVFRSPQLTDPGEPCAFFELPSDGPGSKAPWAPEIHRLRGKWYIYYAASDKHDGIEDWPRRRMFAVEADAPTGPYKNPTELRLDECMSIDGTVIEFPDGRLLMVYMRNESPLGPIEGNPRAHHNKLWMAQLSDPMTVAAPPVQLTEPEYAWEGEICEGPYGLWHDGRLFLIYAGNAAHLKDYCVGLMSCTDITRAHEPSAWVKHPEPVLRSKDGVFGPGHPSVIKSPDGTEDWIVYGTKANEDESFPGGWTRVMDIKKIEWNEDGTPNFGALPRRSEKIPLPSGQNPYVAWGTDIKTSEPATLRQRLQGYLMSVRSVYPSSPEESVGGLKIRKDVFPTKLILRDAAWADATVSAKFVGSFEDSEIGLAARASCISAGAIRMDGYLLLCGKGAVRLLRCEGEDAVELARIDEGSSVDGGEAFCLPTELELSLVLKGDTLIARLGARTLFSVTDGTYKAGRFGIYSHADAIVTAFSIETETDS